MILGGRVIMLEPKSSPLSINYSTLPFKPNFQTVKMGYTSLKQNRPPTGISFTGSLAWGHRSLSNLPPRVQLKKPSGGALPGGKNDNTVGTNLKPQAEPVDLEFTVVSGGKKQSTNHPNKYPISHNPVIPKKAFTTPLWKKGLKSNYPLPWGAMF